MRRFVSLGTLTLAVLAFGAVTLPLAAQTPAQAPAEAPAAGRAGGQRAGGGNPLPPHQDTEVYEPVPPTVAPSDAPGGAPSDAIVLFNGKNLDEWALLNSGAPATWPVADGIVTVDKRAGGIVTKRVFKNYQLHVEWRIPVGITGADQARGNSGVFLASTGPGDDGYELQVLDSYESKTYVNGQAGSIYKQYIPLANAMRKPGEWQVYDIVWEKPVFNEDGTVKTPAYLTAFHNGVLIQNHVELKGQTVYQGMPAYSKKFDSAPIKLQAHGDPSPPISFRNIWVRELPDTPQIPHIKP